MVSNTIGTILLVSMSIITMAFVYAIVLPLPNLNLPPNTLIIGEKMNDNQIRLTHGGGEPLLSYSITVNNNLTISGTNWIIGHVISLGSLTVDSYVLVISNEHVIFEGLFKA